MNLFLIRHAHAADGTFYGDDYERPLTADGRGAAQKVGQALLAEGVKFDVVVSSPLVRAVETAELLACAVGYTGGLSITRALAPDGEVEDILREAVAPHRGVGALALVGHQPSMGLMVGALLARSGTALSKGAVVRLTYDVDTRRGKLDWVITPQRLAPAPRLDA